MVVANAGRFSGFADLYDAHRPSPPPEIGPLLASYAGIAMPDVVDLGSGTGLSSRAAAVWAATVVGVEPSDDMRAQAIQRGGDRIRYVSGVSHDTGLPSSSADVVFAVQAMHWMEPVQGGEHPTYSGFGTHETGADVSEIRCRQDFSAPC